MLNPISIIMLAVGLFIAHCFIARLRGRIKAIESKVGTPSASHNNESMPCEIGVYDEPCKLGYPCKCKHGCLIKRTAYIS